MGNKEREEQIVQRGKVRVIWTVSEKIPRRVKEKNVDMCVLMIEDQQIGLAGCQGSGPCAGTMLIFSVLLQF